MPPVNRLYTELKGQGLERYVAPVLVDRSGDVTGRLYGVWGPPTVYLIDRNGQLVAHAIGARNWSQPAARQLLVSLLAAPR